jgi:isopentenyldiphosphate isomerase
VHNLEGELIGVQDREEFYREIKQEFKESGKITRKVKGIRLLLMNSSGRIYLQQRSKIKQENAGLYDKTVGGHVAAGDSYEMTVIRECAEELGFPATVLSAEEFDRAVRVTPLDIVGVFKKVEYVDNFISERISQDGSKMIQPWMNNMYIGYYDGPIKFVDGESSGIEVFSLEELKKELENNPAKFTEDIKFMVSRYEKYLKPVEK